MGMKHSGKTTLALRLAREWGTPHVDLDGLVEREYRAERPLTCREIYKAFGHEYFMRLETAAASKLADWACEEFIIASLGGGTIDNPDAMQYVSRCGRLVYLYESMATLYDRIMKSGTPAFLGSNGSYGQFQSLYIRRTATYKKHADLTIHLAGKAPQAAFEALLSALEESGRAG